MHGQNNIWHVRRKRAAHINREKNVALPTNDFFPRDIELPVNFNLTKIEMDAVSETLKPTISCLKTARSYERSDHVQNCRCWRPAASHGMQGRDAVAP